MTHKFELYKCKICENIIEVVHEGIGSLVCCNETMRLLESHLPNNEDAHYAHLENIDEITKKITFNHPMTQAHYIEFIEVISNDGKYLKRKFLKENETPELIFKCDCKEGFYVRLYCNIHGIQKTVV